MEDGHDGGPVEDEMGPIEHQINDSIIHETNENLPIFKILRVGLHVCARAILDHVPIRELVRSERVCKQWQEVVQDYMRNYRKVHFCDISLNADREINLLHNKRKHHFTSRCVGLKHTPLKMYIVRHQYISLEECALPFACKTIEKFGSSIVKVVTGRDDEEYYKIIASQCNKLRHIEIFLSKNFHLQLWYLFTYFSKFDKISLHYAFVTSLASRETVERVHSIVFQKIQCKEIEITGCRSVTGGFLRSIKSNNLKALSLDCSRDLSELPSSIDKLRNITSLSLNYVPSKIFEDIHLLLQNLSLLEELSLRSYDQSIQFNGRFITSISKLVNLKRLDMKRNTGVNDELLEALALGCKKLEYLNISVREPYPINFNGYTFRDVGKITASGVAALCLRSPSAVTTLNLGYIESEKYKWESIFESIRLQELISHCCLDLTPQWLEATWRASQGRRVPVEVQSGCTTAQAEDHQKELKIMLYQFFW